MTFKTYIKWQFYLNQLALYTQRTISSIRWHIVPDKRTCVAGQILSRSKVQSRFKKKNLKNVSPKYIFGCNVIIWIKIPGARGLWIFKVFSLCMHFVEVAENIDECWNSNQRPLTENYAVMKISTPTDLGRVKFLRWNCLSQICKIVFKFLASVVFLTHIFIYVYYFIY